ncbi:hypothetical protein C2845_PM17G03960 [Panicum miliaceum]|uniref:Uncharacterized protein n=1 Tax=Panicum miliaceum TaxID=4540 RepID=A0A3L6Q4A1_PANMI|nr:hypothetical protein C2845_PM17G03960 [Panicum miliaceum]
MEISNQRPNQSRVKPNPSDVGIKTIQLQEGDSSKTALIGGGLEGFQSCHEEDMTDRILIDQELHDHGTARCKIKASNLTWEQNCRGLTNRSPAAVKRILDGPLRQIRR